MSRHRVFVTGAAGFVGSALCEVLAGRMPREDVVCLVREAGQAAALRAVGYTVVEGDLAAPGPWAAAAAACGTVYHCGALARFGDGADYTAANVDTTQALLDVLRAAPTPPRFVFVSSIGAVDRTPSDSCRAPLTGDSIPHPLSAYGRSKLECEARVRDAGLPWVIVRPAWVYGAAMRSDSHLAVLAAAVLDRKPFTRVDFPGRVSVIHVHDLVRALVAAGEGAGTGRVLFAAEAQPRALGAIFRAAWQDLHGRVPAMLPVPGWCVALLRPLRAVLPLPVQNLFFDVLTCTGADLATLGAPPAIDFAAGFAEVVESVRARRRGRWLITGAAGGIGAALARAAAQAGQTLYLVDQDTVALETVAAETGGLALAADLRDPGTPARVAAWVADAGEPVVALFNNAGVGHRGALATADAARLRDVVAVNVQAVIGLTRAFLPGMLARGYGRIVNVASSVAEVPLPGMSVYAASKAAVVRFSESLWAETLGTGVRVVCVCPPGTRTGFQARAGVRVLREGRGLREPEAVAAAILRRMNGRRPVYRIGAGPAQWVPQLSALLPRGLRARVWRRLMGNLR